MTVTQLALRRTPATVGARDSVVGITRQVEQAYEAHKGLLDESSCSQPSAVGDSVSARTAALGFQRGEAGGHYAVDVYAVFSVKLSGAAGLPEFGDAEWDYGSAERAAEPRQ